MADTTPTGPAFTYEDSAEPGWKSWRFRDPTRFNGFLEPILVRVEGDVARVRMTPLHQHSNMRQAMHGGAILGFIDLALFAGARGLGAIQAGAGVTLDLATQFIGAARIGVPVEARVELLRETGRLIFLRGLVVQEGEPTIASFTATLRKMPVVDVT